MIASEPGRITVDMSARHPGNNETADIQTIKERADDRAIDRGAHAGKPGALTIHHCR
jgi:hypothetical protein